jgi:hypothetical protein
MVIQQELCATEWMEHKKASFALPHLRTGCWFVVCELVCLLDSYILVLVLAPANLCFYWMAREAVQRV